MTLLGWLLVALGSYNLVKYFYLIWFATATHTWTKTIGAVKSAEVERHGGGRSGPLFYTLYIEYHYVIGDHTYVSDRTDYGTADRFDSESEANARARLYHEGDQIELYFDPSSPGRSVLQVGGESADLVGVLGGTALLGAGLFILLTQ